MASSTKSSTMTESFMTYRTSLALNNMAITLIEKGCYKLANRTLSESLSIIKTAFRVGSGVRTCMDDDLDSMNKIFQAASRRCALPNNVGSSSWNSSFEISVLEEHDFAALRSAVRYGPSSSVIFPIRISDFPSSCDGVETQNAILQLGIVLYNYGLSYLLILLTAGQDDDKSNNNNNALNKKLLKKAAQSFQMSDRVFASIVAAQHQDKKHNNELSSGAVTELNLALLSALVLNCHSLVLSKQNMHDKAEEDQQLVSLLCNIVEQDCFSSALFLRQQSAPAA